MNTLYPLKFQPIYKDKIWGGQKIRTVLGLDFSPLPNCGEVWVVSGVPGFQSTVVNGSLQGNELNELLEIFMDDLVGEKAFEENREQFPILIKFIDSNDYLSIQVHPDDHLARKRNLGNGKTEMWYILEAEKGAELISGFNQPVTQKSYLSYLANNQLKEILNFEPVHNGDVFFIPSGRIHALGPGILLAEIQQTSDVTYRIYDWDRVDPEGRARDLHTDLALDAIDFSIPDSYRTRYSRVKDKPVSLVECPFFVTNILDMTQPVIQNISYLDSFIIYLAIEGKLQIISEGTPLPVTKGEAVLIPAVLEEIILQPDPVCKLLEIFLP